MSRSIGGTIYVFINGHQISLGGSFTYGGLSNERESVVGLDHDVHYVERPTAPFIEMEIKDKDITDTGDPDIVALHNLTDANVKAELANGNTVVLSNAHQINAGEVDGAEGTGTIRFEGTRIQVLRSGA